MFCYVVKIVYVFITIFFLLFFFVLSPFSIGQKGHAFLRHASWWAPHAGQRTMKWPCPVLYAHTRTGRCWAGKYALLWHTNGSGGRTAGATRTSVYFGILLYTARLPQPQCRSRCCFLLSSTLAANAVPCLVSTWLCSSALNPTRRQKPAYMDNLFFWSKFLCPNDYWADFFPPSKPLFAWTSWNAQNVGIVCFFFSLSSLLFFLWAWNRLRTSSMLYAR